MTWNDPDPESGSTEHIFYPTLHSKSYVDALLLLQIINKDRLSSSWVHTFLYSMGKFSGQNKLAKFTPVGGGGGSQNCGWNPNEYLLKTTSIVSP